MCEKQAPVEALKREPKAFSQEKAASTPLAETCTPAHPSCVLPSQPSTSATKTKPIVSLEQLQQDIAAVIDETIGLPRLARLVHTSSLERITFQLEHWHIHKLNQRVPGAGYFLRVVEDDIRPIAPPEKKPYYQGNQGNTIPARDNFDQRDY